MHLQQAQWGHVSGAPKRKKAKNVAKSPRNPLRSTQSAHSIVLLSGRALVATLRFLTVMYCVQYVAGVAILRG